jgi:hypothetical protein
LWPYHHCTIASTAPVYAEYDFHAPTGIAMLLKMCSTAIVTMYAAKNQFAT